MKPRKFRRLILTGHRARVMREAKGHAVPDRYWRRWKHHRQHLGPFAGSRAEPTHGKPPARKPKAKK